MSYLEMPELMREQKSSGKKDKYIEITNTLLAAAGAVRTKEERLTYLTALIETLEAMDFQIYELYRSLQDQAKKTIKELLEEYELLEQPEKEQLSEQMKRACALRILLEEKYENYMLA